MCLQLRTVIAERTTQTLTQNFCVHTESPCEAQKVYVIISCIRHVNKSVSSNDSKLIRYCHALVRVIHWLAVHDVTTLLHIHSLTGYSPNVHPILWRVLKPHSLVVFKRTTNNTSIHLPFCSFLYTFYASRIRWSLTAIC